MPYKIEKPINIPQADSYVAIDEKASLWEKRKNFKLKIKPLSPLKASSQANVKSNLVPTPEEQCSTADMEKYMHGAETTYLSACVDGKGSTFFKFQNGLIFKKGKITLINGAQGMVDSVIVYTPTQTRSYPLVKKTGKELIKREVKLLQAINRSQDLSLNSIQRIMHWQSDVTNISYYSRHEKGGDLGMHQAYIREQYQLKNTSVLSYLFNIMTQLVEGLFILHDSQFKDEEGNFRFGIVHNDIKPANIFVKENGDVIIADFGCGYFADEAAPQYGSVFFTDPNLFLHSEEFCKKPLKNVTKSDVWSLGLTFEVLLRGKLPVKIFNADNYALNDNLPDSFEGFSKLREWAQLYKESNRCKKVREAKDYLIMLQKEDAVPVDVTTQKKIIESFVLLMQLPVEERPTSKELKEYLYKFAPLFGTLEERKEKAEIFVSKLMQTMKKLDDERVFTNSFRR